MLFIKRISALVIAFVLMLTLSVLGNMPVQADGQTYNLLSDFSYIVSDKKITITGYTGVSTEVSIAPNYTVGNDLCAVVGIEASAFEAQKQIAYVELPNTLEFVGEYAFYDCLGLKKVVVNGRQTAIEIGAFGLYYISRRENGIVEGFVLDGYAGSPAEEYATENGLEFYALAADGISSGETTYATLSEAVASVQPGSVLQLNRNITETLMVSKNVTLDLNGYSIDGVITVGDGYALTLKDSATDDFVSSDGYGLIKTVGNAKAATGYIAIEEENGTSYHRLDLQISSVNLRPAAAGIYYSGNFGGDEVVKGQVECYGTALSLARVPTAEDILADKYYRRHTAFPGDSWACGETEKAYGTLVKGVFKQTNSLLTNKENAELKIYSVSYVQLRDGSFVLGAPVSMSLREVVEKVDGLWDTLDAQQIVEMQAMYKEYRSPMEGWNIPNLANTGRKYTITFVDDNGTILATSSVNSGATAELPPNPSKRGTVFLGWSGNYVNVTKDETVTAVYSDAKNVFIVESVSGQVGDTVTVLVTADGNVKTCGFNFDLFYDPALELVSYDNDLDLDIIVNDAKHTNGIKLNFSSANNKTTQRDVIELTFEIKNTSKMILPIWIEMTEVFEVMSSGAIEKAPYVIVDGVVKVQ